MSPDITAEVICHSRNQFGDETVTFVLNFPRIILPELATHRMFSKNSSSSRAIPIKKSIRLVEENPFIPIAWQKDHKGMQGVEYITNADRDGEDWCKENWLYARDCAINQAKKLNDFGPVTKQLCNRLLEPFMYQKVILTTSAECLPHFFNLRCPKYRGDTGIHWLSKKSYLEENTHRPEILLDWLKINDSQAEIHIQALAEAMYDAYDESTPDQLEVGEWHLPFADNLDDGKLEQADIYINHQINSEFDIPVIISTARCARVSYLNFEGKDDYIADIKLHDKLVTADPPHASPLEHPMRAMTEDEYYNYFKSYCVSILSEKHIRDKERGATDIIKLSERYKIIEYGWCANIRGFIQYRHSEKIWI